MTHHGPLIDLAAGAPAKPGVYFLLSDQRELLYVGKATRLRDRLADHNQSEERFAQVGFVAWEELDNAQQAARREADLIVAFKPWLNGSGTTTEPSTYITVDPLVPDWTRLRLRIAKDSRNATAAYGSFLQLGKGKGGRCNHGYAAFLRLLWIGANPTKIRMPTRLASQSPPADHETGFDPVWRPSVHDFMSGRSPRLLTYLQGATSMAPDFMQPGVARDLVAAKEFFELGPKALRAFRRRHGVRARTMSVDDVRDALVDELRETIGEFTLLPAENVEAHRLFGARAARRMRDPVSLRARRTKQALLGERSDEGSVDGVEGAAGEATRTEVRHRVD